MSLPTRDDEALRSLVPERRSLPAVQKDILTSTLEHTRDIEHGEPHLTDLKWA